MKYSPLAVHCTSLCFDVIQGQGFKTLNHDDIESFRDEVYMLVRGRAHLVPSKHEREDKFAAYVTDGVIQVLHQCLNDPTARDSVWILAALESRINLSIQTILH